MHILIATTGALSPSPVADFVERLADPDGRISVITVIEVPRSFLDAIRAEHWDPLLEGSPEWQSRQDAVIARYVEERGHRLIEPILNALRASGLEPESYYLEGEDPAGTIIRAVLEMDADLVVLGATRRIFDESAWESVSARVMAESRRPVLVVPSRDRTDTPPSDHDYVRDTGEVPVVSGEGLEQT
jgi:nucleotide-binding universal stress UspA family protein